MNELLNRVTEKTGLSADQAKAAIESVIGFLKEKLPAPLASSLDSYLGGAAGAGEGLASKATATLGNVFGKS